MSLIITIHLKLADRLKQLLKWSVFNVSITQVSTNLTIFSF